MAKNPTPEELKKLNEEHASILAATEEAKKTAEDVKAVIATEVDEARKAADKAKSDIAAEVQEARESADKQISIILDEVKDVEKSVGSVNQLTQLQVTVNTHCGTVLMTKTDGYTAGPPVRQGDKYNVMYFEADNGYVAIEIPATDTEDAYHVWIDRDCVDIPEE